MIRQAHHTMQTTNIWYCFWGRALYTAKEKQRWSNSFSQILGRKGPSCPWREALTLWWYLIKQNTWPRQKGIGGWGLTSGLGRHGGGGSRGGGGRQGGHRTQTLAAPCVWTAVALASQCCCCRQSGAHLPVPLPHHRTLLSLQTASCPLGPSRHFTVCTTFGMLALLVWARNTQPLWSLLLSNFADEDNQPAHA